MAAGEYVSVSSQADTEQADLGRERHELATAAAGGGGRTHGHLREARLGAGLARTVARQLMAKGALAAHARDELGLTDELAARPLQAALASAATFAVGAGVPVLTILVAPTTALVPVVARGVALVSGGARVDRRSSWRRAHVGRRRESHHLGNVGDARDGRGRPTVRHRRRMTFSVALATTPRSHGERVQKRRRSRAVHISCSDL